ncbi:MAG: 3-dehydroquinate synthase [Clostridia bacterium]|nr:3-dehydroquinate synthase [Clostridia bacterium]MBR3487574.1 3-dehydroquinate synthase [Clostridia bacterium]
MHTVEFKLGNVCRALIGRGALQYAGEVCLEHVPGRKLALITEDGVPEEHIRACIAVLEGSGFHAAPIVFRGGERSKTIPTLLEVYEGLYSAGLTRTDGAVGLGGGVALDMAGFAAATYLRGIPFISLPTTVIAQTDSAFGGKTGVDLNEGKNYVGVFRQPNAVVCDTAFLSTLPEAERICGMGEIIKYGAIAEPSILDEVGRGLPSDETVALCADIKRRFVEADEFDTGERRILNFGHTFGHAAEAASGYSIPHGQAVAYGMLAMIRAGERLGVTEAGVFGAIERACIKAGLDTDYAPLIDKALPLLGRDKKSDGVMIDAVLLKRLGEPMRMKLPISALEG